jgi:hypothetical protein
LQIPSHSSNKAKVTARKFAQEWNALVSKWNQVQQEFSDSSDDDIDIDVSDLKFKDIKTHCEEQTKKGI